MFFTLTKKTFFNNRKCIFRFLYVLYVIIVYTSSMANRIFERSGSLKDKKAISLKYFFDCFKSTCNTLPLLILYYNTYIYIYIRSLAIVLLNIEIELLFQTNILHFVHRVLLNYLIISWHVFAFAFVSLPLLNIRDARFSCGQKRFQTFHRHWSTGTLVCTVIFFAFNAAWAESYHYHLSYYIPAVQAELAGDGI